MDLPDEIEDDAYLGWLDNALSSAFRLFEPDLICYVAGADPYKEDQLGGLNLTIEGLKRRDELVFQVAQARDIPIMVTYAGGYAQKVDDTVRIHCNTVAAAKEVLGRREPELESGNGCVAFALEHIMGCLDRERPLNLLYELVLLPAAGLL